MSGSGEPSRNMWVASGTRSDTARKNFSAVLTPETFQHCDSSSIRCEITAIEVPLLLTFALGNYAFDKPRAQRPGSARPVLPTSFEETVRGLLQPPPPPAGTPGSWKELPK